MENDLNKSYQNQFLQHCKDALLNDKFKRVVFASAMQGNGKKDDKFKTNFELVLGGKKKLIQYSDNRGGSHISDLNVDVLMARFLGDDISPFRAATLCTDVCDWVYSENRKGEPRLAKAKASMKDKVQTHNKPKNYVLSEKRPYLRGLGVTNGSGVVVKKHYAKFRQIANFVEIIDRDISDFVAGKDEPIGILDLGCGKGYLTFATYDYVRERAKHEPKAIGIDIKTNVVDLCNKLSDDLGFEGLDFRNARIQPTKPEDVDILIALHACDTATDDALALGLRSNMQYLFCAPCCQAEIAQQTGQVDNAFNTVNAYALMQRRQADIVTDVCRALLLSALGYEVKFLEFTALEHTAKNIMLVGKKSDKVDREKAYKDYLDLKKSYGFKKHSLEENIKDLLPASL